MSESDPSSGTFIDSAGRARRFDCTEFLWPIIKDTAQFSY